MSNELYLGQPDEDTKSWIKNVWPLTIPFHFECLEDGHIQLNKSSLSPTIELIYSFDNKSWNDWDYLTGTDVKVGDKLFLRAKTNNTKFTKTISRGLYFSTTNKVNVVGNIMSLLYNQFIDKKSFETNATFVGLFYDCTNLLDASNLILPVKTLQNKSYTSMFSGCISIVQVPKLIATELPDVSSQYSSNFCYYGMFTNCLVITELHYPKSIQDNTTFTSIIGSPWFGATNATVYYDL